MYVIMSINEDYLNCVFLLINRVENLFVEMNWLNIWLNKYKLFEKMNLLNLLVL